MLTEEAYERLKTIGEFTDLGSGFKIAMRDLEIRGAGNLLGQAQSGHIAAVGFDLYCQMVTEAVGELKGEPVPEPVDITIDVPVDANLPRDYVAARRRAHGGVPAARRGHRRPTTSTTSATSGRTATARRRRRRSRCSTWPGCGPSACASASAASPCSAAPPASSALALKESQKVRLRRLAPKAVAKDDELVVPVGARPAEVATTLVDLLQELLPPGRGSTAERPR